MRVQEIFKEVDKLNKQFEKDGLGFIAYLRVSLGDNNFKDKLKTYDEFVNLMKNTYHQESVNRLIEADLKECNNHDYKYTFEIKDIFGRIHNQLFEVKIILE